MPKLSHILTAYNSERPTFPQLYFLEDEMPRSNKKPRAIATFTYPAKIEVRQADFEILDSVNHLDLDALARAARADVEVGYVKTSCCQHLVRAEVRKGVVTGLKIDSPSIKDRTPVSPELASLLKASIRKLRGRTRGTRFPIPVSKFFGTGVAARAISVLTCIQICIFGWCIACCWREDIPNIFFCGRVTIDTTSGPYPE